MPACQKERHETLNAPYQAAEMEVAVQKARSTLKGFIGILESGQGEDFSVKVGISDGDRTENIWLTNIVYSRGEFVGLVGDDPGLIEGVAKGQEYRAEEEKVVDWLFTRSLPAPEGDPNPEIPETRIYGGYTTRVLLPNMDPVEAEVLRLQFAEEGLPDS